MHPGAVAAVVAVVLLGGVVHALVLQLGLFPRLCIPLDLGAHLGQHRLFGANKTVRGLVVMVLATAVAGALVFPVVPPGPDRSRLAWAWTGAALGLAYIVAELPNSFVKRHVGIAPGQERVRPWQYLADQADSVVGVTIAAALLLPLSATDLAVLVVAGTALHVAVDQVLHRTGVKHPPATPPRAPTA